MAFFGAQMVSEPQPKMCNMCALFVQEAVTKSLSILKQYRSGGVRITLWSVGVLINRWCLTLGAEFKYHLYFIIAETPSG